jgi:hypothetical protein
MELRNEEELYIFRSQVLPSVLIRHSQISIGLPTYMGTMKAGYPIAVVDLKFKVFSGSRNSEKIKPDITLLPHKVEIAQTQVPFFSLN